MILSSNQISILSAHAEAGDRAAYYTQLAAWGDPYAPLALSVVTSETLVGAAANAFFQGKASEIRGQPFSASELNTVGLLLMQEDFSLRSASVAAGQSGELGVDAIWTYHQTVYASQQFEMPAEAWTAHFPLNRLSPEGRAVLWSKLLNSTDMIPDWMEDYVDLEQYVNTGMDFLSTLIAAAPGDGSGEYLTALGKAGAEALLSTPGDAGSYSINLPLGILVGDDENDGTVMGSAGNDVLMGYHGNDVLAAASGDDRLYGGAGDDTLIGGEGADRIVGGEGNDIIYAGIAVVADSLPGGAYSDDFDNNLILAGSGDDNVYAGGGSDIIALGDGDDKAYLSYQQARTILFGGDGADSFYFETNAHILILQVDNLSEDMLFNLDTEAIFDRYNAQYSWEYPYNYIIFNLDAHDHIYMASQAVDISDVELVETSESGETEEYFEYHTTGIPDGAGTVYYDATNITKISSNTTERHYKVDSPYDIRINLQSNDDISGISRNTLSFTSGNAQITIDGFKNGDAGIVFEGDKASYEHSVIETNTEISVTTSLSVYYPTENKVEHRPLHWVEGQVSATAAVETLMLKPNGFDSAQSGTIDLSEFEITATDGDVDPGQIDAIVGTAQDDRLEGTWGDDVLAGNLGDDTLLGDAGSDTYIYGSGDGNDYIDDEAGFTDNTDVLWLTDLNADDVQLSRSGLHLLVTITATGEVITIDEQFYSDVDYWGIEKIQFADGSFLDREDILQAVDNGLPAVTVDGTAGYDTLEGTWENDVIRGGLGNDTLLGSAGSDTYIYAQGDGSDYIDDEAGFTDNADVLLLTDLNANEISLARNGLHLEITVIATGDVITIDEQFYSDVDYWGIEKIQFADGTTMNRDAILTAVGVNQDGSLQVASNAGRTGSSAVAEPDVPAATHVEGVGIAFATPILAIEYDLPADSDGRTTAHSAEIISLADYLGTNIVPEQNDALWYEPEPIGAVI